MSQQLVLDSGTEDAKQMARILYLVHACTFFFSLGMLSFLPLIVNYIKRPDTSGTIVYSHHSWMIRSFWFYALWMVGGRHPVRHHYRHSPCMADMDGGMGLEGISSNSWFFGPEQQ